MRPPDFLLFLCGFSVSPSDIALKVFEQELPSRDELITDQPHSEQPTAECVLLIVADRDLCAGALLSYRLMRYCKTELDIGLDLTRMPQRFSIAGDMIIPNFENLNKAKQARQECVK